MFEKVNPSHPDKLADRIAGAIVDLAYKKNDRPKIAVEVLIGYDLCTIIIQSSEKFEIDEVDEIVTRIAGKQRIHLISEPQDNHLSQNQQEEYRCGDNGIFKGVPLTGEEKILSKLAREIYEKYPTDGKYILDGDRFVICQSHADSQELKKLYPNAVINPLGDWTGGTNVDVGCTNRKLGSDMAQSVTGGGLCLSGDTEYLGEDLKWHRIDEYKGGKVSQWNNGNLEFVLPNRYIHNKDENFITFENNTKLSMKLTPNHDVLIRTSKGNLIKHKASHVANKLESDICNMGSIIHNFNLTNKKSKTKFKNDDEYKLQVAFCADGSILPNKDGKWNGRIRLKKKSKKETLREILKDMDYKETKDKEYSIFWVQVPILSKSLFDCFSDEDWTLLKEEVFNWDGDNKRRLFRTTIKEDADFIQLVLSSNGKTSTILKDDRVGEVQVGCNKEYIRKTISYTVTELKSTTTGLRENKGSKIKVVRESKLEDSYCFSVPSNNLVVRHNDKIFITGNCGKDLSKADVSINIYAFLKAQETNQVIELSCAIGDTKIDGKTYSEIVEIAKDYIDSLGGFEKFAEWGLV